MKKTFNLCVALLLCMSSVAQSMRDPTAPEKMALMRVIKPLNQNINLFVDDNWQITEGFDEPDMDVPNGVHDQLGTAYLVTIKVKEGTPLYNEITEPVKRLMQENKPDSLETAYKTMEEQSIIHIDVTLNAAAIGLGTMPGKNKQLKLPGVSKGFIVAEDNYTPRRNGAYVLAFGHWQNATYDSGNKCYRFRFGHPPQAAYIENVVLELYGDTARINKVLSRSDWSNVTAALDR